MDRLIIPSLSKHQYQQFRLSSSRPQFHLRICRMGGSIKHFNFFPMSRNNTRWRLSCLLLANMRSMRYKIDELYAVMELNHTNIACITESWLNDSVESDAISIDNFVCYRRDRQDGRRAGGVACYVDSTWPCTRLSELEKPEFECLWLLLRRPVMPRNVSHIAIGVVYHPPDAASYPMSAYILDCVDSIRRLHPSAGVIVLGDFNSLHDGPVRDYPLKQMVTRATRGKKILDKIFTNVSEWYGEPVVIPAIALSDHRAIVLSPKALKAVGGSRRINVTKRSNSSNGRNLLASALVHHDWQPLYSFDNIDTKVDYFNESVKTLLDVHLPLYDTVCCVNDKPWVTAEFRRLIRSRQFAWSTGDRCSFNKLRNRVNRLAKVLRADYYNKIAQKLHKQNPRVWWQGINKLTGRATKTSLQPLIDSAADGDIQYFASSVNRILCEVSQDLKPVIPPHHNFQMTTNRLDVTQPFSDDSSTTSQTNNIHEITVIEVFNELERIDVHKSPGPDGLPNWALREYAFAISEPLCHIFNYSLQNGVMPDIWKAANVVLIPKCHPPTSIKDDLRPISLTATLSKVLERLIGRRFLLNISSKFDTRQYGALKGRSTLHALIDVTHMCHQALDNCQSVRCLFVDFRKAFDHVDHGTALRKMAELNIDDIYLRWMRSYLSDRRQRVKVGNVVSPWLRPNGGMPQGSYLGPYVFLIMINDLIANVPLIKFVDDVTAIEIVNPGACSHMQTALDQIACWSGANFMEINTKKSKQMVLGKSS